MEGAEETLEASTYSVFCNRSRAGGKEELWVSGFSALLSGMLIGGVLNTMAGVITTETTGQRVDDSSRQASGSGPGPNATNDRIVSMAGSSELSSIGGFGRFKAESVRDITVGSNETTIARFGRDDGEEFQSLIEFKTLKSLIHSGSEIGRGAIRLIDNIESPERTMELGTTNMVRNLH